MNQELTFNISDLRNKSLGASIDYKFEASPEFEDIKLKGPISGDLSFMVVEDGVLAQIKDFQCQIILDCDKCIQSYSFNIKIPEMERVFLYEKPEIIKDPNDLFMIDMKKLQIDVSELVRQEIILQFPLISVCSKSCKGICPMCGNNRNKQKCDCKIVEHKPEKNYPLAKLKDLLK